MNKPLERLSALISPFRCLSGLGFGTGLRWICPARPSALHRISEPAQSIECRIDLRVRKGPALRVRTRIALIENQRHTRPDERQIEDMAGA